MGIALGRIMTVGFVDATVLTHMFRKHPDAIIWFKSQTKRLSITPIQWLELMVGAPGKRGQETCLQLLAQFEMVHLTPEDQTWTMNQMHTYRLSHGVSIPDCLIASVAFRLQVPLYTHDVKHMQVILNPNLVIKPYDSP